MRGINRPLRGLLGTAKTAVATAFALLGGGNLVFGQINLNGGPQSVAWTKNCSTTELFNNNTRVTLVGLWVGIGNDGVTNPPEIRDISVHDAFAALTWDVDDNEDFDNNDGSEADEIDSTPTGLATGWHRVQARNNADVIGAGVNFTLKLCDSSGGSLAGRTIFLLPIGPTAGQTGGDLGVRTELPILVRRTLPSGSVVLDGTGAPPGSTTFTLAAVNADPLSTLRKVRFDPPTGTTILTVVATGGGVYDGPTRTIIWPTPIPAGASEQVTITLSALASPLLTTITVVATVFLYGGPAPALPLWAVITVIFVFALGGYRRLLRQGPGAAAA